MISNIFLDSESFLLDTKLVIILLSTALCKEKMKLINFNYELPPFQRERQQAAFFHHHFCMSFILFSVNH